MKALFTMVLLLCSSVVLAFHCDQYTFINPYHHGIYLYRLSYSDIPADAVVVHVKGGQKAILPYQSGNLLLKKKKGEDEYAHCAYVIDNGESGKVNGTGLFKGTGEKCPILAVDRCDVTIQEREA